MSNPDVQALRSLANAINKSLDAYESAVNPRDKVAALTTVGKYSQALKDASVPPADAFADFTFRPLANACVRIALSIDLFDHLPQPDEPGINLEQLATKTNTSKDLIQRVTRGLLAFNVIQTRDELYSHTPMSLVYADPARRSWAIWMWDVMIASAAQGLGRYFDGQVRPIGNPTDSRNSPFTVAHGAKGSDVFEIVKSIGKLPLLNNAMSGSSVVCAKEAVASFDFSSLQPGKDDVLLVDVGGAKGQTIREIQNANPGLEGKMVLQDLQTVIDDGPLPDLGAEIMTYDFFKQEQPIRGAAAYLYQRIFHDWSDENSEKILKSLRPAMHEQSRLLICDVVVQDDEPHPRKVLRDINMLLVGGLERSQQQWRALLERAGFVVEAFHGLDNPDNSIIEARLNSTILETQHE